MATYAQFRSKVHATKLPRITWLSGKDSFLRALAISDAKDALGSLDASSCEVDTYREFYAAANQYPLNDELNRLVIFRGGESHKEKWSRLFDWLANNKLNPKTFLLIDSKDDELKSKELPVSLLKTKSNAIVVICSKLPYKAAGEYVLAVYPNIVKPVFERLVEVAGEDSYKLHWGAKTLSAVGATTPEQVDVLLGDPAVQFVDSLLAGDKPSAYRSMDGLNVSSVLGLLHFKIKELGKLNLAARQGHQPWSVSNLPRPVLLQMSEWTARYTPSEVARRSELLIKAEQYSDYPDLALSALVYGW